LELADFLKAELVDSGLVRLPPRGSEEYSKRRSCNICSHTRPELNTTLPLPPHKKIQKINENITFNTGL
jgi:hypothetical protein